MPQRDVVAHLLNLADKSLVVTEAAQGQQRYHMLETVRQFAAEQLQVAGETEITVRQHRDWFLALALKAEPYLTGPQELEWLARLEADHANLKAALDRSLAQHDGEQAAQLATALRWFWDTCGYLRDSYRYFDAVLEHAAQVPVPLRVRALDAAGMAAFRSGNIPLASTLLEEGASLSRTANDAVGLTTALNDLGLIEFYQNHAERAMALFQESLALARTRDDAIASIRAIGNMGILAMVNADGARAEQYFAEGLTMVMQVGSPRLTGIIYTHLGFAALLQGHVANAAPRLVQGLKRHRHVGDKVYSTYALFGLAGVAGALAEPERMARL
jgi:tetratricopeptide (TPR) repeat protein